MIKEFYTQRLSMVRKHWPIMLWMALLLIECISYTYSSYPANSFYSVEKIGFWVMYCLMLRFVLIKTKKLQLDPAVWYILGGVGFLLSLGAMLSFMFFRTSILQQGWTDLSRFKGYFSPYGLKLNNWATIAICFLPFPLIAASLLKKHKLLFTLCLLGFSCVVFAVLISFSRGAYLSLVVFGCSFLVCTAYYRLIPFRKLIIPAAFSFGMVLIFCFSIAQSVWTTMAMHKTVSQQRSTAGRWEILQSGMCKLKDHLWTGVGGYNFSLIPSTCSIDKEDRGYSIYANNLYVQILIEKGCMGLLIYGLLFISALWLLLRSMGTCRDPGGPIIPALLFSGLLAYCFRELFFASFFENTLVLCLVGFYITVSQSHFGFIGPKPSKSYTISLLVVFSLLAAWFIRERLRYTSINDFMQSELKEDGLLAQQASSNIEAVMSRCEDIAPCLAAAGITSAQKAIHTAHLSTEPLRANGLNIPVGIGYFQKALSVHTFNAEYLFNLACLYTMQEPPDTLKANSYFRQSLSLDPYNSEFLIGYGLWSERIGNTTAAYTLYHRAIRLDPEIIESRFYRDLKNRNSHADTLIIHVIEELKKDPQTPSSPILAARLGSLLLAIGDTLHAKSIFQKIILDMPDLNRPYYNLGRIALATGNDSLALNLFKKSLFLNRTDYMPLLALGDYYYTHSAPDTRLSSSIKFYFKTGLALLQNNPSQYTSKSKLSYILNSGVTNGLIFKELGSYIRLDADTSAIRNMMIQ